MIDLPIDFTSTTTQSGVFFRERDRPAIFGRPSSASTVVDLDSLLNSMSANFAAATYEASTREHSEFEIEPINTYKVMLPLRYLGPAPGLKFDDDDDLVLFDE